MGGLTAHKVLNMKFVTKHIEYELNLKEDLTTLGYDGDFEDDELNEESAKEALKEHIWDLVKYNQIDPEEIIKHITIKKIWLEEEE